MFFKTLKPFVFLVTIFALIGLACGSSAQSGPTGDFILVADQSSQVYLGPDCKSGLLGEFHSQSGICVTPVYVEPTQGQVLANQATTPHDQPGYANQYGAGAFLAADGAWLNLGLKNPTKIGESPVVFGIDSFTASQLGWTPGSYHSMSETQSLLDSNQLKPVVCNASRCPTGALFFAGVISSLKGLPGDVLSTDDVDNPNIIGLGKDLYTHIKSADTETDAINLYVADKERGFNQYNSLVVLEANVAQVQSQLANAGKPGLVWFYLTDGTLSANATIGCLEGDTIAICNQFQAFMTSETSQSTLAKTGWRPSIFGVSANPDIIRSEWGLSLTPSYSYTPSPTPDVMAAFINKYVAYYRTPTQTYICGDDSGSMYTNGGKDQFIKAMRDVVFSYSKSAELHILPGPQDETTVTLFGADTYNVGTLVGNDANQMAAFGQQVISSTVGNNSHTAIYDCGRMGLDYLIGNAKPGFNLILILMTDGGWNYGSDRQSFINYYNSLGIKISIYSIALGGDAKAELGDKNFGNFVNGVYFDGNDLVKAFEKARGSN